MNYGLDLRYGPFSDMTERLHILERNIAFCDKDLLFHYIEFLKSLDR